MKQELEKRQNSLHTLFWTGFVFSAFCHLLIALGSVWHQTSSGPWGFRVSIDPPAADKPISHEQADRLTAWRKWNRQSPIEPWTVSWPDEIRLPQDNSGQIRIESKLFVDDDTQSVCLLRALGPVSLYINGRRFRLKDPNGQSHLPLAAGINHIRILWTPLNPEDKIRFTLKKGFFDHNLPYHAWQRPDHPLAPFLSKLLRLADSFSPWGFYLSLISLVILFGRMSLLKHRRVPNNQTEPSFRPWIMMVFNIMGPFLILSFLNQFLRLRLPLLVVTAISMLTVVMPRLVRILRRKGSKGDEKKTKEIQTNWIPLLLVSIVFTAGSGLYVFGRVVPPVNLQLTDLSSHLEMSDTILTKDHFLLGIWADYPQGPHAFLALLAKLFSTTPQTLVIPLLLVFYLLFLFLQFLLCKSFFPRLKWVWPALAFLLGYPIYFYTTMFRWFMFPAILSAAFLMAAILQHRSGQKGWSGVSLLAGITVYPLFSPVFLALYLINDFLSRPADSEFGKFIKGALPLILSTAVLMVIYTLYYVQVHSNTHHLGSNYTEPLELFSILGFLSSSLSLWGLHLTLKDRDPLGAWGLVALLLFTGVIVAGQVLHVLSHYYILKTLTPLYPFLLPFIALGLQQLAHRLTATWRRYPGSTPT